MKLSRDEVYEQLFKYFFRAKVWEEHRTAFSRDELTAASEWLSDCFMCLVALLHEKDILTKKDIMKDLLYNKPKRRRHAKQ